MDIKELSQHATDLQRAKIMERRNRLRRRIDAWIIIQQLYMPAVAALRRKTNTEPTEGYNPESIELFMPSQLAKAGVSCAKRFLRYEWEFRYAQGFETLDVLRRNLLLRGHMLRSKDQYARGQRQNTRSQSLIKRVQAKINAAVAKYRIVRQALLLLAKSLGKTEWEDTLMVLDEADVQGINVKENERPGEGRRQLSWIWKSIDMGCHSKEMHEGIYSSSTFASQF